MFLTGMLDLLRASHADIKNHLNVDFHGDLTWFAVFLPLYNGVLLYDHKPIICTLELDAWLTGPGGRWKNWVYLLPIQRGFRNCSIVHLKMVNILLAVRLFCNQ